MVVLSDKACGHGAAPGGNLYLHRSQAGRMKLHLHGRHVSLYIHLHVIHDLAHNILGIGNGNTVDYTA